MRIVNRILIGVLLLVSTSAWSSVFIRWTNSAMPPSSALGVSDLVLPWDGGASKLWQAARKQGYRVYIEVSLQQARAAAEAGDKNGFVGIMVSIHGSKGAEVESALRNLRRAHPKLRFLALNADGKRPEMRGSLVIQRDSVLEVSSPTAQPWIDTNLALLKMEKKSHHNQTPLYSFAWRPADAREQTTALTATDYSLAVAEEGAFDADLVLQVDERLQRALSQRDPEAWTLWNKVRSYIEFYSHTAEQGLESASNVAVVVDDLDPTDEAMNLLARHNIPFEAVLLADFKARDLDGFDVVAVFSKADTVACNRIAEQANRGKTVVLVDSHAACPFLNHDGTRLNENATSYAVGNGRVIELSEPITDPETFAQDIRRLLGKQNVLISLWNGLTTVAVPYRERGGGVKVIEFVNYAGDPVRLQVQVKGLFSSIRYEAPGGKCCESLIPAQHNGFTEFIVPDLEIAGRVYLEGAAPHSK